jgi:hypothetical protein
MASISRGIPTIHVELKDEDLVEILAGLSCITNNPTDKLEELIEYIKKARVELSVSPCNVNKD